MAEIQQELQKLFELAGLQMPEKKEEAVAVASYLNEVLSHFQKIADIDTKGVASLTNPLEQSLRFREDEALDFSEKEAAFRQAPEKEGQLIKVPLVT